MNQPTAYQTLPLDTAMQRKKRGEKKENCPFCRETLMRDVLTLSDGTSVLRENKMPIIQESKMYVLIESLHHDTHFEDMEPEAAGAVLDFAFRSMAWVNKQYPDKQALLFKNRGELSGGSQPHPHMQVVSLPHFDKGKVEFESDREIHRESAFQVGLKMEGAFELYQLVFETASLSAEGEEKRRAIEGLQALLRWAVVKHGHYNLAHWRKDGKDFFKIIPRWAGSAYGLGFCHYIKYDEAGQQEVIREIRQLMR